ncbi:hypothetical protein ACJJIE_05495 [Microbulbifer sp. TRSA001]|uniref:hypothetical protein n=1 Tax=unclassified Microbulbifer TaxID=2619833 RepID=UPI0024AD2061|nr:hypothetical protein [Microbulbifer sp. VAAF005]WHI47117.1 hypothetical protein P0078_01725 [Microbulbifer sp. VAAF005]
MDLKVKEGQVWKYDNREGEENSRVIILKIEESKDDSMVVHAQISGIKIYNPNSGEVIEEITHMPFSIEALGASLNELMGESEIPDFEEGYDSWKREYDNGKAGVFTISIGEAVKYMDDAVNS